MKKKLLIVVNVDWFFISHRIKIAEKAIKEGWDVYVAAKDTGRSNEIRNKDIKFIDLPFSRSGLNIVEELRILFKIHKIYKTIKPDVVHQVTLKPIVYGSLVSKLINIDGVINAISGLGYMFTGERKGGGKKTIIKLMRYGFDRRRLAIIFQNKDDYNEIKSNNILSNDNKICFIKGSGVDLKKFEYRPPREKERIEILLPCRMLWDKGIRELKEASEILKKDYKGKIKFVLAGLADEENKAGVSKEYLKKWEEENYVEWIGYSKDMIKVYESSDIVVLPSYREGLPKSLIEACAIGRPIVTTNAIGCKECVDEGINGYKVNVNSSKELAIALEKLICSENERLIMGKNSRKKAENEFSLENVINTHLEIYNELYNKSIK